MKILRLMFFLVFFSVTLLAQDSDLDAGDDLVDTALSGNIEDDLNIGDDLIQDDVAKPAPPVKIVFDEFEGAPAEQYKDMDEGNDLVFDEFEGAPAEQYKDMDEGNNLIFDEFEGAPADLEEGQEMVTSELGKPGPVANQDMVAEDMLLEEASQLTDFQPSVYLDPLGVLRRHTIPDEYYNVFRGMIFYRSQFFFQKVAGEQRHWQHELNMKFEFTPRVGDFRFVVVPEINIDDFGAAEDYFALTSLDDNGKRRSVVNIAEAFVETQYGPLDISIGKRIYAFGAAFGPNPTDLVNAFDVIDPIEGFNINNDRKIGVVSALLRYHFSNWGVLEFPTITAIFVPRFTRNRVAFEGSRWFFNPFEGLEIEQDFPSRNFKNSQLYLKASTTVKGYDLSLMYYEGLNHFASQEIRPDINNPLKVVNFFDNIRVAGGDAVTTYGPLKLFLEFTHTWSKTRDTNDFFTIAAGGSYLYGDLLKKNDRIDFIFEVFFNNIETRNTNNDNVIVLDDEAGDRALIFSINYEYDTEITVRGTAQVVFNEDYRWTSEFYEVQILYQIHSNLVASLKAQFLNGRNTDLFGIFKDNDNIFLSLDYTF